MTKIAYLTLPDVSFLHTWFIPELVNF